LYDKVVAPANLRAAWDRINRRVTRERSASTERESMASPSKSLKARPMQNCESWVNN
jgi:hypothetical protein